MRGLMVFIQDIRACKSKEAEMKRINKELANIRSKFKNEKLDGYQKKKYVCKLLFIFLLGIDVDFGYQEAVNLLSSVRFSEKQIGYLFVSVIFGENHDLMPLVIQAIRLDLQSPNSVFKTLAMQCVANIGSKQMAAQIGPEIPVLLTASHTTHQVKQTAALCLVKLLRIDPRVINHIEYAVRLIQLLNESHLGVVTAGCSLLAECVRAEKPTYRSCVSVAVQRLQRTVGTSGADLQDYMYYFTPAPWLSVMLLKLVQMYPAPGEDDALTRARLVESIEAILSRSQEPSKSKKVQHANAKNAVLFEAINVITHMENEPQLQVRACNLLGTFLGAKETNLRYLSLEHLSYLATSEFSHEAVRKHQETVILALKNERDVSVRQRAVDLLYAMCDHTNAVTIVTELLEYLKSKADYSIREELVLKIAILAEIFAPDSSWYVDTMLNLIRWAGDYVSEEVWHRVIQVIINRDDVQGYAAKTCFESLQAPSCHETMIKVGAYILGEFGNQIAGDPRSSPLVQLGLLHSMFHLVSTSTRSMLLTTYMKFVNLFPEIKPHITEILKQDSQARSGDTEIQQRALEYMRLATVASADLLASVMDEMPPFPEKGSRLLEKLKKKDPKQARIHEDKPTGVDDMGEAKIPDVTNPVVPEVEMNAVGGANPVVSEVLVDLFGGAVDGPGVLPNAVSVDGLDNLTAGWEVNFRQLMMKNSGVLYEDDQIQIGVKSEYKSGRGRLGLFYGNKCNSPLTNFTSKVKFPGGLGDQLLMQVKPVAASLESGAQVQQLLTVECRSVFTDQPRLMVNFSVYGGPKSITVKLPIVLSKFLETSVMSAKDFFDRWKHLGEVPDQEAQSIFEAKFPMEADACKNKLKGFGMAVLPDIDPNPSNFVSAGIVSTTSVLVGCLLRLEPNNDIKKYRLTIRSSNALVSRHLLDLLVPEF